MKQVYFLYLISFVIAKFPEDFKFGVSTSAYQIEGSWLDDNKGLSMWDNLVLLPGYIKDGRAPHIAANSWRLYPEDIELMKKAGIKDYRMSLSWSRIIHDGRSSINNDSIKIYRDMFEKMNSSGITPYVTLYYRDIPATLFLQGHYLSDTYFKKHFEFYAKTCFERFGDIVKYWFTFNDPWTMSVFNDFHPRDSDIKPYTYAHNILVAHALTVKHYRDHYQDKQKGKIGIVLNSDMYYPKNKSNSEDNKAADRALAFQLGWFADPIFKGNGDYPDEMKERLGNRLVPLTEEEKKLVSKSSDFFALNHYTSYLVTKAKDQKGKGYWHDRDVDLEKDETWNVTDMGWPIVPEGIYDILIKINKSYNLTTDKIPIFITENGMANKEEKEEDWGNDEPRIHYMRTYLEEIERAIDEGINVQGYFVWSLLDSFEWKEGFTKKFGLVRVEFEDLPKRKIKESYRWYEGFIRNKRKSSLLQE